MAWLRSTRFGTIGSEFLWLGLDLKYCGKRLFMLVSSAPSASMKEWKLLQGVGYEWNAIEQSDLETVNGLADFHRRNLHNLEFSSLIFTKCRQLYDYIRAVSQKGPLLRGQVEQKRIVNSMLEKLEEVFQREATHSEVVKRLIVSTPYSLRFLHRTSVYSLVHRPGNKVAADDSGKVPRSIMKSGLKSGANLEGTATMQPREEAAALRLYRKPHKSSNAIVVIELPRHLWKKAYDEGFGAAEEVLHPEIGTKADGGTLSPNHVIGYFDQLHRHKFHLNPRYEGFRV